MQVMSIPFGNGRSRCLQVTAMHSVFFLKRSQQTYEKEEDSYHHNIWCSSVVLLEEEATCIHLFKFQQQFPMF